MPTVAADAPLEATKRAPWTLVAVVGLCLVAIGVWGADRAFGVAALAIEGVFLVYFVRHLAFAVAALRTAGDDVDAPDVRSEYAPTVTVMAACHNEETVAIGLLDALMALDYDPHRVQFILVDDASSDRTGAILDEEARRWDQLEVVHRPVGSTGGKSGALNEALLRATGEIIVVFDADHQPRPDVLWRLVRHFADPTVGAVQGRCVIRNGEDSLLARLVAIDYMAGYLVNEYGRQAVFGLPAYGGANCAVRSAELRAIGGWNPLSVTEDTDLTMRLTLTGSRVRYDVTAVDEEEGVVTLRRYWRQRYRWARGHQQVCRDYRRSVLKSPRLSLAERVETLLFLFAYHLPVLSAASLVILGAWVSGLVEPRGLMDLYVLWTLLFLGPLLEIGAGLLVLESERRNVWAIVFFFPLFMVSIALCAKAWFDSVVGSDYSWAKTSRRLDPARASS